AVSALNSLVGSSANDQVGSSGVAALSNGNNVVLSPRWDNAGVVDVGAFTWSNGSTGKTLDGLGIITPQNSILGQSANAGPPSFLMSDPINQAFVVSFSTDNNSGRVVSGFPDPNLLTFARGGTRTLIVMPEFLAQTLAAGVPVTVQAVNTLAFN